MCVFLLFVVPLFMNMDTDVIAAPHFSPFLLTVVDFYSSETPLGCMCFTVLCKITAAYLFSAEKYLPASAASVALYLHLFVSASQQTT